MFGLHPFFVTGSFTFCLIRLCSLYYYIYMNLILISSFAFDGSMHQGKFMLLVPSIHDAPYRKAVQTCRHIAYGGLWHKRTEFRVLYQVPWYMMVLIPDTRGTRYQVLLPREQVLTRLLYLVPGYLVLLPVNQESTTKKIFLIHRLNFILLSSMLSHELFVDRLRRCRFCRGSISTSRRHSTSFRSGLFGSTSSCVRQQ